MRKSWEGLSPGGTERGSWGWLDRCLGQRGKGRCTWGSPVLCWRPWLSSPAPNPLRGGSLLADSRCVQKPRPWGSSRSVRAPGLEWLSSAVQKAELPLGWAE